MNHNEYRAAAAGTAIYPGAGERTILGVSYLTLGLVGEVSEIAELVEAIGDGMPVARRDLLHELGDVLWYDAMLTAELGISGVGTEPPMRLNRPRDPSHPSGQAPVLSAVRRLNAVFGLVTAAGQVAEIVKKAIRAGTGIPADRVGAALATVRGNIDLLAADLELTVEEIRQANVDKLAARFATNTIKLHA